MVQIIAVVIILIIAKLVVDFLKEQFSFKSSKSKPGDVIDISDAWVDTSTLPYKQKGQILNRKELSFYHTLAEILTDKNYILCPRIQMSELLSVTESPKQQEYVQRLKERTFDLVVFEASSFKPALVFNLEETEPGRSRQLSNRFTAKALEVAGLPLMIINLNQCPKPQYLVQELRKHGLNI